MDPDDLLEGDREEWKRIAVSQVPPRGEGKFLQASSLRMSSGCTPASFNFYVEIDPCRTWLIVIAVPSTEAQPIRRSI